MNPDLVGAIIAYAPFALVLLALVLFMRKSHRRAERMMEANGEIISLNRQMVDSLRNIEKTLENRNT